MVQDAAVRAIQIWWEVLFPALLPFLILSELMIGFGIVHMIGTLLDPVMRPLFRVPGIGGYVMAVGFASGYPVGAKLSAQLTEQGQLTRIEGERLAAFTTTADPMFMTSAVAIGFLGQPQMASVLMISHYGAAIIIGLLFRYYRFNPAEWPQPLSPETPRTTPLFRRAIKQMHRARLNDGRNLGELLTQAIEHAIQLVLIIGGFVVGFAVLLALIPFAHMESMYALPVIGSLLEVTLGVKSISELAGILGIVNVVAMLSFALAWGGLSVHVQIMGISSRARFRYLPFVIGRFVHGGIAICIVYVIWPFVGK
ncbi:MAG: sporulation integral rane protein YlbJ [Bacillota bacterium]